MVLGVVSALVTWRLVLKIHRVDSGNLGLGIALGQNWQRFGNYVHVQILRLRFQVRVLGQRQAGGLLLLGGREVGVLGFREGNGQNSWFQALDNFH
jgi:hypothetical protein